MHRERLPLYETREAFLDWVVMQWGTKAPKFDDARAHNDGPWGVGSEGEKTDDQTEKKADKKDTALVISGGIKGGSELEGKPAILDIPVGKGRVVAFNFDPIHRTLSRSDFRMVWNAILNWNDFPPPPTKAAKGAP